MAPFEHVKVCIVGGGVSGLALARALELLNISYILLERYHHISPPAGASLGLQPNGLRILDQLGYVEPLSRYFVPPVSWSYCDGETGDLFAEITAIRDFETIFGYGMFCVERQRILQTMYDGIQNKSKILLSKKVEHIQNFPDRAIVSTTDGGLCSCDIVVGADGVHSMVRRQIEGLQSVPAPPDYLVTRHDCAFGISGPVKGIEAGQFLCAMHERVSVLTLSVMGGDLYWFAFRDLQEDVGYRKTRRYTREDAEQLCKECSDLHPNSQVTFKQLYDTRKRVQMFSLEEGVSQNWYAGRMVLLGDAAHKLTTHSGMGGNIALESVASLVNHLRSALEQDDPASQEILNEAFARYNEERYEPAKRACQISAERCRAVVSGDAAKAMRHVMPNLTHTQWLYKFAGEFGAATCLENWPWNSDQVELYNKRAAEITAGQSLDEALRKYSSTSELTST